MPRHETVTNKYISELESAFYAAAFWVRAAQNWLETKHRMTVGTHPCLCALRRVDEGWSRDSIDEELGKAIYWPATMGLELEVTQQDIDKSIAEAGRASGKPCAIAHAVRRIAPHGKNIEVRTRLVVIDGSVYEPATVVEEARMLAITQTSWADWPFLRQTEIRLKKISQSVAPQGYTLIPSVEQPDLVYELLEEN